MTMPATAVSEASREEETLRFAATLLSQSFFMDTPGPLTPRAFSTSSDPALAAFAQLGAMRLQVDRVLVSLFDGKRQHVVAEATAKSAIEASHADEAPSSADDVLFFLGTAIPRAHGVCELVLDLPYEVLDGEPVLPIAFVPDISKDDRFTSRPYFRPEWNVRFYAGVPLRSPQGVDIGVCCILDKQSRDGLSPSQQHLLRHISNLVMTHLQSRALAEGYQRNERKVRGLGALVEGAGSISKWRDEISTPSFPAIHGPEDGTNSQKQHTQRYSCPEVTCHAIPPGYATEPKTMHAISDEEQNTHKHLFNTSPENEEEEGVRMLKLVFSRAANIIKESIDVEGAIFLDASIGSYGGLVQRPGRGFNSKANKEHRTESSSSGNESTGTDESNEKRAASCGVLGFSYSGASSINGDDPVAEHSKIPETFLSRLHRRYPEGQIFNFRDDGMAPWGIGDLEYRVDLAEEAKSPDELLPPPTPPPIDYTSKKPRNFYSHPRPRRGDGAILQRIFPKARSVAIFPLRDSQKEKWHAGGLVWSVQPSRLFTVTGELSYLRAFGSAVMAEVTRIDVLRSDKAKEDVLGSLSHEIRSPLHGIILGLELMHDTALDTFQEDVLHTVETCGRTLLDTMDHLLDFSKVNHFLRGPERKVASSASRGTVQDPGTWNQIQAGMMTLFSDIHLDALLEEIVESVYAGFTFQQTSSDWAMRDRGKLSPAEQAGTIRRLESVRQMDNLPSSLEKDVPNAPVDIYLSIDPAVAWNFHAQPGALRRIMMNIFGNALKYTQQGSILVSLTQDPQCGKTKSRRKNIIFSVSDSGRGISSAFLQNRLFAPFTQENQLSSGSGLGLSIVKQIVHTLGGRISVESKPGHGTTVRVSIPLMVSPPGASPQSTGFSTQRDMDFSDHLRQLEGYKVSLQGFSADFGSHKPLATDNTKTHLCPTLFMKTLCRHFLRLQVLGEVEERCVETSEVVVICTKKIMKDILGARREAEIRPVVVICNSILAAHELSSKTSPAPFPIFISQPIGPRKLAKTLTVAIQRWEELKASGIAQKHSIESDDSISPVTPGQHFNKWDRMLSVASQLPLAMLSQECCQDAPATFHLPDKALPGEGRAVPSTPRPHFRLSSPSLPPPLVSQGSGGTNAFLLVDDNSINLKILASYLKKLDRSHDNAMNGLEALDACRSRQIHYKCIFMDISMPIMDGLEATRHIRAHEQQNGWAPALIIALTGLGAAKTQQEAFASGIDLFLTKPVPLKELGHILESRNI